TPDPLPHDLIDPDRSLLAQLEEDAINGDDDTYEWLIKEAYHDPDIMSLCHNFRIQIPDNQQEQPPPVLTWEEIERGRAGLSGTSEMPLAPTVAERAFLALARDWQAEVEKAPKASVLPRDVDIRALACLLLAVEWGEEFTGVAREQMEANRVTAAERQHPSWMNELPWRLCQSANIMGPPPERDAVQELTANLDHHKSSIRCWMMEIGWFAFSWLNPVEAAVRLLNNLADTLAGPFMAAGLAARFFDKPESFLAFARSFTPPESFKEQYRDRLKYVEEHGVKAMQAPFWQSEAICRKEIERVILGFQRAGEHRT
ncbi:MAG: hypothetical protein NTV49_05180, partial [Kiritimatiellaeota bacterium]|nr:hypothetical protein [Kiritimatiellota bacterium]